MRKIKFLFISLIFVIIYSACAIGVSKPGALAKFKSLKDIKSDEVIVVGKFLFDPPFTASELEYDPKFEKVYKNKLLLIFDDKFRYVSSSETRVNNPDKIANIPLYKTFFRALKRKNTFILHGNFIKKIYHQNAQYQIDSLGIKESFKINFRPEDKAIYIGTITIKRDRFGTTKGSSIKDEYNEANKEFIKKYGSSIKLRKSFLQKIDTKNDKWR